MKRLSWRARYLDAEQRCAQAEFAARINRETIIEQQRVIAELQGKIAQEKISCIANSKRA